MKEEEKNIIAEIIKRLETALENENNGHDLSHSLRVYKTAIHIAEIEKADIFITGAAALLHDLGDYKLNAEGKENHREKIETAVTGLAIEKEKLEKIIEIAEKISFKGNGSEDEKLSLEGTIVRDADRLDAIGAIGIARAFAYGGSRNRKMYDYNEKPEFHKDFETYKKSQSNSLNHFYEKLFLLKDRITTDTAKKIAEERHNFMKNFIEQFEKETK